MAAMAVRAPRYEAAAIRSPSTRNDEARRRRGGKRPAALPARGGAAAPPGGRRAQSRQSGQEARNRGTISKGKEKKPPNNEVFLREVPRRDGMKKPQSPRSAAGLPASLPAPESSGSALRVTQCDCTAWLLSTKLKCVIWNQNKSHSEARAQPCHQNTQLLLPAPTLLKLLNKPRLAGLTDNVRAQRKGVTNVLLIENHRFSNIHKQYG